MDTKITIDLGRVARETGLPVTKVERTVQLLDEGNTVPFITRYRKDQTGGLDEEQIRLIQDRALKLRMLAERKQTILKSIESQGKLTPELANEIRQADSTKRLEDLYLPYKPRKQTLAETARQRGLEPLAREILDAAPSALNLDQRAADFISEDRKLKSVAEVLLGVGYLLAERFSERADLRGELRQLYQRTGVLVSTGVESNESKSGSEQETGTSESARRSSTEPAPRALEPATTIAVMPPSDASALATELHGEATWITSADSLSADSLSAVSPACPSPLVEAVSPVPDDPAPGYSTGSPEPGPCSSFPNPTSSEPLTTEPFTTETFATVALVSRVLDSPTSEFPGSQPAIDLCGAPSEETSAVETSARQLMPDAPPALATFHLDTVSQPVPAGPATSRNPGVANPRGGSPAGRKSGKQGSPHAQRRLTKKEMQRQRLESAFQDYVKFEEPISKVPPHRVLAINRGERAKMLRVKIVGDLEQMIAKADQMVIPAEHPHREFLRGCLRDSLNRLVLPSLEREIRREMTDFAEYHAVDVFVRNLRKLLLQPPVRGRRVLAMDPGFKSGCKITALDEFGKVLAHDVIFVVGKEQRIKHGREKLAEIIRNWQLSVVAIGNGTASRDTSQLVADVIANELQGLDVAFVIVNEAGASIYSTSTIGREEFPEFDAVARGAISIGRRLLDPLSELVKINPANIGVGLYQHDVKAKHLRESLDAVVESCVNYVGVDANTASPALLRYVSGLNQLTARRLYEYRQQHGPFRSREQFKEVPSFGDSAFVQAAGFLKITGSDNPLDSTWIHPESYELAAKVLEKLHSSVAELGGVLRPRATSTAPPAAPPTPAPGPVAESLGASQAGPTPDTGDTPTTAGGPSPGLETAPSAEFVPSASPVPTVEPDAHEPNPHDVALLEPPLDGTADPGSVPELAPPNSVPLEAPAIAPGTGSGEYGTASLAPESASVPVASGAATSEVDDHSARSFLAQLADRAAKMDITAMASELGVGELLLKDIITALTRPGRDPREDLPAPVFRRGIMKLEDLRPGMELSGTVLNVVDFGAFVDIGLTDSGLVHISRLADRYVRDPHTVVSVGDILRLWVVGVDKERRRVSLTAIEPGTSKPPEPREKRPPRPQQQPRPPQRDTARKQPARPEGGRTRHDSSSKRPVRPPKFSAPPRERKPKPVKPITKEMEDGSEPMRSFSDLLQFYSKKKDEEPEAG